MNKIPENLRNELIGDSYYLRCTRSGPDCRGRITWEHTFIYAGKQIQEKWAIIPLCWFHHLGAGLNKGLNKIIATKRTNESDRKKYPKINWKMYLGNS